MKTALLILSAAILVAGGCASQSTAPAGPGAATLPSAVDAGNPRAYLTLDQIQPAPVLSAQPTSRPADPTPPKALELFANGLESLWSHHPYPAVDAFREALKLDPYSFELNDELGRARLEELQIPSDESFAAFEMAAALRPDDMQTQLLLGRQYMSVGDAAKALEHLRLAIQTDDYKQNAPGSAAVELNLARALETLGYDQAAVDEYAMVSERIAHPTSDLYSDPDMSFAINAPHLLELQRAQLYERLGEYDQALELYQKLTEASPATFVIQAQAVRMLIRMGKQDEAIGRAADILTLFGPTTEALGLLHEACNGVSPQRELDVLRELLAKNPSDHGILFALADALNAQGRPDEARKLLTDALNQHPRDGEIVRKLFDIEVAENDSEAAAKLLIIQLAENPDSLGEISPMLAELIRPNGRHALRPSEIQKLDVPDSAQAAKLSVLAESADYWNRDALERASIEEAVKLSPPFPPAYRRYILQQWGRQDLNTDQKIGISEELAHQAETQGNAALAAELRGLSLAYQGKYADASSALEEAMRLDPSSVDLLLTYAAVLARQKENLQCEQALWKAVAQWPKNDSAWASLHDFYVQTNRSPEAIAVLSQWLKANPASPEARVLEATWSASHGQEQFAVNELGELLHDHADDLQLIQKIESAYVQIGHAPDFVSALVALRTEQPTNLTIVSILSEIFVHSGRPDIAIALLDETRRHVATDADMLYEVASLYHEIGQEGTSEQVLQQVLQVDPQNPAASNDLGFYWADEGVNLDRAEKLIRLAVEYQPDNEAFLDSLGWVLYKQGRFGEAVQYFQTAIGSSPAPDAEILDHFGDDLYRLGRTADAGQQWKRALVGLSQGGQTDEDTRDLRQQIGRKLHQMTQGTPVQTAPLGLSPPATTQPAALAK